MFLLRIIFFYFIFSFAYKLIAYFIRLGKSSYSINKENNKNNKQPFNFKNVVDADFKDNDDEEE